MKLGEHFFQTNPSGGLSPVWDFRGDSAPSQPDAFVVAAKVGNLPAPTGHEDVDWLQLNGVSGALATTIYRTHTKGGQPPTSVRHVSISSIFLVIERFSSARLARVFNRSNTSPSIGYMEATLPFHERLHFGYIPLP